MDEGVQQAINQFPGHEAHIRHLWVVDEDFQELCHDYALCLDTLLHCSTGVMSMARRAEYHSLRQQLEFEIEMKIRSVQPQRD